MPTPAVPTPDRLVAQALLGLSSPHASKLPAVLQKNYQHLHNVMRCMAVLLILGTGICCSASGLGKALFDSFKEDLWMDVLEREPVHPCQGLTPATFISNHSLDPHADSQARIQARRHP